MSNTQRVHKTQYWAHIDGLRAFAVIAVLLFHFKAPGFNSGYLGVDIFFVISGFLVSHLIIKDINDHGRMRFGRFFARRIRRLFPALAAVCIITTSIAYFFLDAEQLANYGNSVAAAIISLSNINFWNESGYFDTASDSKLLLHTWSLSVEEQFYLIWPATLALGYKFFKNRALLILSIGGFFFSVGLIFIWKFGSFDVRSDSTIFFWMPFRVFEFMMGAVAILIYDNLQAHKAHNSTIIQNSLCSLGLLLMLCSIILPSFFGEPFGPTLGFISCLGAVLIILTPDATLSNKILSWKPVRWIGQISYTLYLVHWPLWVLLPEHIKYIPSIWMALIGLSILLTLPIYYLIETPLRYGKLSGILDKKNSDLTLFFIIALIIVIGGLSISKNSNLPFREPATLSAAQIKEGKKARFQLKACEVHLSASSKNCFMDRSKQVLFFGNSHELDGYNTFHEIYKNNDQVNLIAFANTNNCNIYIDNMVITSKVSGRKCSQRVDALNKLNRTNTLTHIVYSANQPFAKNKKLFWSLLNLLKIQNPDLKIIVVGGFLNNSEDCSVIINRHRDIKACLRPEYRKSFPKNERSKSKFGKKFDFLYLDKILTACPDKKLKNCVYEGFGEPMFYDPNHLSFGYSKTLGQKIKQRYQSELQEIGLPVETTPIYLLVRGQSNAVGQPEYPPKIKYLPNDEVQIWNGIEWITADPNNWPFKYSLKHQGTYNFGLAAARKLNIHYKRPIRIILNAQSGAKYDRWISGNKPRWNAERRALESSGASEVIVLSHQGEAHHDEAPETFINKLNQYEELLSKQSWFSGTILHGGLLPSGDRSNQNSQIHSLTNYVSSEGLTGADSRHFDSKSLQILGERYADKIIELEIVK